MQNCRWVVLCFAGLACAAPKAARGPVIPSATEVADPPVVQPVETDDLTELGLVVSGYDTQAAIATTRPKLEALIAPVITRVSALSGDEAKGRAILDAFHGDQAILTRYEAHATSLADVLEGRRYNCLSASVLYAIIATRVGLTVAGELLPSHARIQLRVGPRWVTIETTSPHGFDASPEVSQSVLTEVTSALGPNARALVGKDGAVVEPVVLFGAVFVNRASLVQEKGDLTAAERLFARGEALAPNPEMRQVLRDQRAVLLSQLASDDIVSEALPRIRRAYGLIKAAAGLGPSDPIIRSAVHQNLRAATERLAAELAQKGKEREALARVDEALQFKLPKEGAAGLRAFVYSEIARYRAGAGDLTGAIEALERALKEEVSPEDQHLVETLQQNRRTTLRLAAMTSAERGDYPQSMMLIEKLLATDGLSADEKKSIAEDRRQAMMVIAQRHVDAGRLQDAANVYRDGLRLFPDDAKMKNNLLAALQRLVLPTVNAGGCDEAEATLQQIAAVSGGAGFVAGARRTCKLVRARKLLDDKDFAGAVSVLSAVYEDEGKKAGLVARNLGLVYLHWIQYESRRARCDEARRIASQLAKVPSHEVESRVIRQSLGRCVSR